MRRQKLKYGIRVLVLGSCLLAGCMTSQQRFQQGLQTLHGRHLEMAMQRLGIPVGEENVAGMRVLVWSVNEARTDYVTQSTAASGGLYNGHKYKDYGARIDVKTPVIVQAHCTVRLRVGPDDIVQGSDYSGDMRTCRRYIHALHPDVSPFILDGDIP